MTRRASIKPFLGFVLLLICSFAQLFVFSSAQAACTTQGCVMAGPRLASIDSTKGALLNALLGNLTGSSVNVNVLDWQQLAGGNVNVAKMISALQTQLNVSTPSQALNANATLLQVLNAAAAATVGGSAASVTAALANVAVPLSVPVGGIVTGDLLKITGAAGQTTIDALDLVTAAVQLYNHRNVVTTNAPVTLSVAGVTGVNNVTLAAQVVEPPVYVCGPSGSTFHSAAIRIKLNVTLPAQSPLSGVLNGILGVASSSVTLGSAFSLYIEVARAEGTIGVLNAISNTFSVQASPGVADMYIGQIADAVFFNRNVTISQASFSPAPFGSLTLTTLGFINVTGTIGIKAYARGQAASPTTLNFTPAYPRTGTAYAGAGFASTLLSTLLSNLTVTVTLNLLPILNLDASISGVLTPIVSNLLSPVLASVTTVLIDPLLSLLGIKLGEAVITAAGVYSLCSVTGSAYRDANHNAMLDASESGTGVSLYAKLIRSDDPTRALQIATINTSTGAYSFSSVATADYTVLVDTDNVVGDVTAATPAGWFATEAPTLIRSVSVSTRDVPNQNFGLFNGSKVSGRVFRDDGVGSGSIANNVVRETNEAALPGIAVNVTSNDGSVVHDSTSTLADGVYTLWIPASAGATALKVTETNTANYVSTGAAVGNTGGTYSRATDTIGFTNVIGTAYSNVNFGDVPASLFETDGRQSVLPGNAAFYPHRYVAGTSGTVTLTASAPALAGWSHQLYRDTNCNGSIDTGEAAIASGVPMTAAQSLCIVARVFAAQTASYNEQYPLTLSATFAFANSAVSDASSRNDLTIVGDSGDAGLLLTKSVDRATALPGQALLYTIAYTNHSNGPLSSIVIHDSTPAYTVFTSANCGALPVGITACQTTTLPAAGATGTISWTLSGNLLPGATGTVTFQVTIQ